MTGAKMAFVTGPTPLVEERLFIGGKLRPAANGRVFDNISPVTEQKIGVAADGNADDMREAIGAARIAYDTTDWSQNHAFRAQCLRQLHEALVKHASAFRATMRDEIGATESSLQMAIYDAPLGTLLYAAHLAETFEWEKDIGTGADWGAAAKRILVREGAGVAACITPWNAPMQVNIAKIGPALAAGCTVVLKPAPDTPWSGLVLGKLVAEETDIPLGVFNVVTTNDNAVAQILAEDPRVDIVSFTGSTKVGQLLMAVGAQTVKRVFLELGGKSPFIMLDDAELDQNIVVCSYMITAQAGQGCSINTRMLVHRSIYQDVLARVKATIASVTYGDPAELSNYMGPVINARQHARVLGIIERAKAEGIPLLCGGGRPAHLEKGYFVEPTVFYDVDPKSFLAQEEIFGPVLAIIPFDTDDEAIEIANNTVYGLAGTVLSRDLPRARKLARRIRSGVVNINNGTYYNPSVPFGGYKQSGLGREMGEMGFEEFTEVKIISEDL
jgi:aldehyde dehydrogenase (NAD+)